MTIGLQSHTGDELATVFARVLDEFNISDKVHTITLRTYLRLTTVDTWCDMRKRNKQ